MFYSQCLISKKGPFKPIWVAAYCHKNLKKSQVAETNISSSVDEIMLNEVAVTYRVLGYLLLGVVRIFSKKVEYLYHDCNLVLTKIKNSVSLKKLKESMCATYASITLPERFELDGFDLGPDEDMNYGNIATPQQITLEEEPEDVRNGYSFDKFYCEVDLACLGIDEAICTPIRDARSPYSMGNYVEVYPSSVLRISEAGMEFQGNELSGEEFSDSGMNFGADEPVELGTQYNEVYSQVKQIKLTENISSDRGKSVILHEEDPLAASTSDGIHESRFSSHMGLYPLNILLISEARIEPFQGNEPPREEISEFVTNCGSDNPVELGEKHNEVGNHAKRIKLMEITPLDPGKSGVVPEDLLAANTEGGTSRESKPPSHEGVDTPEHMVIRTPSKKEHPRFSRKRKLLFDESIVLSNEVMRQSLHDPSNLIVKRRKCPLTALDVWRMYKLSKLYQDFQEPLIPCTRQLKTLYCERRAGTPQPFEFSEGPSRQEGTHETHRELLEVRAYSNEVSECPNKSQEVRCVTPTEPSEQRASSLQEDRYDTHEKSSKARPYSNEACESPNGPGEGRHETHKECSVEGDYLGENAADNLTHGPVVTPTTSTPCNVIYGGVDDPSEIEAQNNGLNLTDEELHPLEEHMENQCGWSIRTRKVVNFLSRSFQKQKECSSKEVLSLKPVLNGRTRTETAILFYEILVLKSVGFVDVKQDGPYDDIYLVRT